MASVDSPTTKFCDADTVDIFVGEDKRLFRIHSDRLCDASSFFKAAFTNEFKEKAEKKMDLPEEDEDLFELFVQWLYHQRYEIPPEIDHTALYALIEPVKLYVLAEKYDVGDLRSLLIKKLFAIVNESRYVPRLHTVAYAFDHVSQNSGLCKLLADWYACKLPLPWFATKDAQDLLQKSPELAAAILFRLATTTSRKPGSDLFDGEMPETYKERPAGGQ